MSERNDLGKPKLRNTLRLKCPYCGKTRLQKPSSWFDFDRGCQTCDFRYEREVGYYTGSAWMVNYTIVSAFGIMVAAYCALATDLGGLAIASIASASLLVFGFIFFPFGHAIWMYFDHLFHPLQDRDRLDIEKLKNLT